MHRAVVVAHLQIINSCLRRTLTQSALSTVSDRRNGDIKFPDYHSGSLRMERISLQYQSIQSDQGSSPNLEHAISRDPPVARNLDAVSQAPRARPKRYPARLRVLARSIRQMDVERSWEIYQNKVSNHPRGAKYFPTHILHFLLVLLTAPKLKTRQTFLRILAIITELRRRNPKRVRSWEWGAAMDAAAKGHRITTWEDYHAALGILMEWEGVWKEPQESPAGITPGSGHEGEVGGGSPSAKSPQFKPNIIAHLILIAIASRTESQTLLHDALLRLDDFRNGRPSRPPPEPRTRPSAAVEREINRCSLRDDKQELDLTSIRLFYLSRIPYYTKNCQPQHVVSILTSMIEQELDIGVDGINAAMWSFAYSGEVDVARGVYDLLRTNITNGESKEHRTCEVSSPSADTTKLHKQFAFTEMASSTQNSNPLLEIPGLINSISAVTPNHITYSSLVQAYCYRNRLEDALHVFRDYLGEISKGSFLFEHSVQSIKPRITQPHSEGSDSGEKEGRHVETNDPMEITTQRVFSPEKSVSVEELAFVSFRAIIQGFAKHGVDPQQYRSSSNHFAHISLREASVQALTSGRSFTKEQVHSNDQPNPYTLHTLLDIFHVLMSLPCSSGSTPFLPPYRFYRMVMKAFRIVSGNDSDILHAVYEEMLKGRLRRMGMDEEDEEVKRQFLNKNVGWKRLKREFRIGGRKGDLSEI
ncbi:hypothetical protein FRC03_012818 [Tulasnella sp. 419]|nr:hypothetical protein FRC03_012818 [Tulasnella sp. 419]